MSSSTGYSQDNNDETPQSVQTFKLVILGEVAVGKTSIIQRFYDGKFSNLHQSTIGGIFLTKQINYNERIIKFDMWDTAGQEKFHSLTPLYYKKAKAAIVVFDVTNKASYDRAQRWVSELLEKATPGIVIALCGNKIDLEDRKINKEEAEKYAQEIGSFYCEVSAKTNVGIVELFHQIVDKLPTFQEDDENNLKLNDFNNNNSSNENSRCGGYCSYF